MKITCESCGAKYTIADDKVIGRKVKIRCKGCSTPIVVDGQKMGPSGAPPAGAADAKPETIVPTPSASVAPSPEWSVNFSESDQRSMTTQQIVEAYRGGQLPPDVYVWKDGFADWVPLLECAELAPFLTGDAPAEAPPAEAPPPPNYNETPYGPAGAIAPQAEAAPAAVVPAPVSPTATPAPTSAPATSDAAEPSAASAPEEPAAAPRAVSPARARTGAVKPQSATADPGSRPSAARVTGGRSQGAHDLFAGVDKAGSESLDVPMTSPVLPQAGTSAYHDDRPTGARNENSVLFSLDALKVANPTPAPEARKLSSDDPFGMGGSAGIAGIGGGNPLFTLADNQRLLSAPPPPPEPPPRAVEAVASHPASIHPALAGKKALWVLGGAVLVVLLLGVGIGAMLSGGDDDKQEVASAAPDNSTPEVEKKPEKPEEPAKTAEAEPPPTSEPVASASAEKPEEKPTESDTKGHLGATKPGAGSGAKKEKKEEAPAPVADQPFNRGAAVAAMSSAASAASSCKKPGGPTGTGKVSITFAPTGRVTAATVDTPPFAGTSVGGCVAGVFRRAKVPPFTGNPIRVSKSFTIR